MVIDANDMNGRVALALRSLQGSTLVVMLPEVLMLTLEIEP